jgi:hypothetical protein
MLRLLPRDMVDEFERLRVEHRALEQEFQRLRGGGASASAAHQALLWRLSAHRRNLRLRREGLQRPQHDRPTQKL